MNSNNSDNFISKTEHFSQFFSLFFESSLNFEHFQTKMTLRAYVFPKLPTTKDVFIEISKNSRLRGPVEKRHGKQSETLIQS